MSENQHLPTVQAEQEKKPALDWKHLKELITKFIEKSTITTALFLTLIATAGLYS